MKYVCAQGSRQGGRGANEDRVAIVERDNAALLVLGDGLGGYRGGALASATLCQVAIKAFRAVRGARIEDPSNFLALVIFQTHQALKRLGPRLNPPIEPRTTCVLCLVQEGCAYWAHVGDSRLYHFRYDALVSRTRDDTVVDTFRERGILDERESRAHPDKSRLLACLGGRQEPLVRLSSEVPLRTGDLVLLCSDGVWEALETHEQARLLAHPVLESGLSDLLAAAENRRQKAADNISAAALRWQDAPAKALGRAREARSVSARDLWNEGRERAARARMKALKDAGRD